MGNIEYVIYCRKSTDESSGQQVQSIPDQIKKCMEYARNNDMKIALKPKDFGFETEKEVWKEDNDTDFYNKQIYKDTKNLYIIKEQDSAKVPGLRKKWKRLIRLMKDGKIKGLLSYSPDRQARNMLEGGELIDCVDQGLVDLKYTNFHFENTASGKMMLGIWFVFSKQYSDKLSEDITRGKNTAVSRGKSMGRYKYGYYRDENDSYYKPHPKYFPLMKEAFEMKLYAGASDQYIADWLNAKGFLRENKKEKKPINSKMLGSVWIDEFYYGMYIYGESIIDMREVNSFYQPLINENEHNILRSKYEKKAQKTIIRTGEHKYEDIRPLPKGLLQTKDGTLFTPYIAGVQRFEKKLAQLKVNNPNITLKDIIKPNQIRFRIPKLKLEVTFNIIEKEIIQLLNKINIDEKAYQKYIEFIGNELDRINFDNKEKYSKILLQLNRAKGERKDYIKKVMLINKTAEQEKIYQEELNRHENKIDFIQTELNNINSSERNSMLEFQIIVEILQKAGMYYKKANNVQKAKICEILFSNIFVDKKKKLTIKVNSSFSPIFSGKVSSFGDSWTLFEQVHHNLLGVARFQYIQNLVQFYVKELRENNSLDINFTEKEEILYGLKSFD